MSCLQNVGYVFGNSTKGQRAVYEMGRTGIPVVNCNNNCATGEYSINSLSCGPVAVRLHFEWMNTDTHNTS